MGKRAPEIIKKSGQEYLKVLDRLIPLYDERDKGFYCICCKRFSKECQTPLCDYDMIIFPEHKHDRDGRPIEAWRVFLHYDGCRIGLDDRET